MSNFDKNTSISHTNTLKKQVLSFHCRKASQKFHRHRFSVDQTYYQSQQKKVDQKFAIRQNFKEQNTLLNQRVRRKNYRKSLDQGMVDKMNFKCQQREINDLQKQLSQVLITTLNQKRKKSLLTKLISVMDSQNSKYQTQSNLRNSVDFKKINSCQKQINKIIAWMNKLFDENENMKVKIRRQKENRVQYSQMIHKIEKSISQNQKKYLKQLWKKCELQKILKYHKKNQIQKYSIQSSNNTSTKRQKIKKVVSIKPLIQIQPSELLGQSNKNGSQLEQSCIRSLRIKTFHTLLAKFDKFNNNQIQQLKSNISINNLIRSDNIGIFQDIEQIYEFYSLRLHKIAALMQIDYQQLRDKINYGCLIRNNQFSKQEQNQTIRDQISDIEGEIQQFQELLKLNYIPQIQQQQIKIDKQIACVRKQNQRIEDFTIIENICSIFHMKCDPNQIDRTMPQIDNIIEKIIQTDNIQIQRKQKPTNISNQKSVIPKSQSYLKKMTQSYNKLFSETKQSNIGESSQKNSQQIKKYSLHKKFVKLSINQFPNKRQPQKNILSKKKLILKKKKIDQDAKLGFQKDYNNYLVR